MTAKIQLTQGQTALVDAEDYDRLMLIKWHASRQGKYKKFYACSFKYISKGKKKKLWMHRIVTDCPDDMVVHHIDGDGLNNCKHNLMIVTYEENAKAAGNKTARKEEPWT